MNSYEPVNCDFHDQLEALATLHQDCQVTYRDQSGQSVEVQTHIVDVYTKDHAEFCKIQDGTEIRLDRILAVNGRSQAEYSEAGMGSWGLRFFAANFIDHGH